MSSNQDRDDILYSFSVEPEHSRATIDRYLDLYPELAEDLLDLMHEIQLMQAEESSDEDAIIKNALKLQDQFAGDRLQRLARSLDLPRSFMAGFRDKVIRIETIPQAFLRKVSMALGTEINRLVNFLATPTSAAAQQAFKANGKPDAVETISFEEFVDQANLTEDQRAVVYDNGASDELNR